MKLANIKSPSDFTKEIERIVIEKRVEYFDAVILYCEMNNLDV